jgi:hypothetical protein
MSRAVDRWPSWVSPWAFRNVVRVMPSALRRAVHAPGEGGFGAFDGLADGGGGIVGGLDRGRPDQVAEAICCPSRSPSLEGGSDAALREMRTGVSRLISPFSIASKAM